MGGRAGGGAGSGRGGGGRGFNQGAFDKATDRLYSAIASGNKGAIAKATAEVAGHIGKMSPERVKTAAKNASESAYYSSKKMNPKSEYNPTQYKYNTALAKLYNKAANKK